MYQKSSFMQPVLKVQTSFYELCSAALETACIATCGNSVSSLSQPQSQTLPTVVWAVGGYKATCNIRHEFAVFM